MFENSERTEISKLGEFGLIKHITQKIKLNHPETIKGVGDDAAVLNYKKHTLISTDMLVEGIHFDLTYTPLKHLGYKSVVVNVSDICAMNGIAKHITVSIGISNRFSLEAVEEFYSGVLLACEKYKIDLIGGDTSSTPGGMFISITVLGEIEPTQITYRNGANENDLICVTGDLGAAYMGLQILEREKSVFKSNPAIQPDLEGKDYILERQLKPEARTDMVQVLSKLKIVPTAMIDISDGLASELMHIAEQSGLGCVIYEDKLPIDPLTYETAREFKLDPTTCLLSGGEDYELLFTIQQKHFEAIKNIKEISIIGHITEANDTCHLISKGGQKHKITAQGWNSFANN